MTAHVCFSMDSAQADFGPCALTIGNFDGVHLGHQALLKATGEYAREHRIRPAVLTFHPHPAVFVAPERVPELICSLDERVRLLSEAGAERILVLPFNDRLARFTPYEFVAQIVVEGLRAQAVFVGENFRFGHKQAGTTRTLTGAGTDPSFRCVLPAARPLSRQAGVQFRDPPKHCRRQCGLGRPLTEPLLLARRGRGERSRHRFTRNRSHSEYQTARRPDHPARRLYHADARTVHGPRLALHHQRRHSPHLRWR